MKFYLALLFLAGAATSFSQTVTSSVVAVAGDVSKSDRVILEWTLGETVVETGSTSTAALTQGFHQPLLLIKPLALERGHSSLTGVSVFPNPAASFIHVQMADKIDKPFSAVLVDTYGRVLPGSKTMVNSTNFSVDLRPLAQGAYFLRFIASDGSIFGNHKVVKIR